MTIFALQAKANLVNVTRLQPRNYSTHRWFLKYKCTTCGEQPDTWQYATLEETHELPNSRRTVHLLVKCPFCKTANSAQILTDSYKPCYLEDNETWQEIVRFDCRGMELIDFDPRDGWVARGYDSETIFEDIDLGNGEWADYDEKTGEAVEIKSIEYRFVAVRGK